MMRSLFSGISGLKTHQTRMDVIGNNIANVNTVAYKSSSATFSELMYQTSQRASGPNSDTGRAGQNAKQIGLGVKLGSISSNIAAEGSTQSTGNAWHMRINGDAFFVVSQGTGNSTYFTRDGAFYVDGQGNLAMASTGYNIMGWQPDPNNPDSIKVGKVSPLRVMSAENMTYEPEATTKAYASGMIDRNDASVNSATGRVMNLTFYDSLGYSYTAQFSFHQADDGATPPVKIEGQFKLQLDDIMDSTGKSLKDVYGVTNISDFATIGVGGADGGTIAVDGVNTTEVVVQYDTGNGKITYVDNNAGAGTGKNFNIMFKGGHTNFENIEVDMGTTTFWDNEGQSTIGAERGASGAGTDPEGFGSGRKVGALESISVDTSGRIYASYDNSMQRLLGQIAVASFANPSGLEKMGDNLYNATMNSGNFDGVGKDVSEDGTGSINTGVLEMSNVDLSAEFTEMITTQRGFQANSRIITVSDTLLEELVNLKR